VIARVDVHDECGACSVGHDRPRARRVMLGLPRALAVGNALAPRIPTSRPHRHLSATTFALAARSGSARPPPAIAARESPMAQCRPTTLPNRLIAFRHSTDHESLNKQSTTSPERWGRGLYFQAPQHRLFCEFFGRRRGRTSTSTGSPAPLPRLRQPRMHHWKPALHAFSSTSASESLANAVDDCRAELACSDVYSNQCEPDHKE
jgi:hypothetical protein